MNDVLSLIFTQQFLVRALVVGTLISLCAALLGVSLVLKRFSMIGDGLSHVGFGAMAIACAANVAPLYFSLPIVIVAAFLLLRMSEKGKIKGDAAIALISTGALAVGVMATSMTTGMNVDIYNYMFGSILTMSEGDVVISSILAVVIISLFVILYHEIFAVTFDESFARATGTRSSVYNMIIAALTAVTIVIGMRMMGALLISSLIIFPTVISMRVCKSYKGVVICSVLVSVFSFIAGLIISVRYEAPTGASVVVVNIAVLAAFSLLRAVLNIQPKSKLSPFRKPLTVLVCLFSSAALLFVMFAGDFRSYSKERVTLVATSFAGYDFARAVAGDKAQVIMLLSPGEESHTYEPSPEDIITVQQCDVFIYGGGESDTWVESVLDGAGRNMQSVRMMDCVELFCEEASEGMQTDEHDHSHEGHSHGESEEYDEHVWTSPANAVLITEAICEAVSVCDSKNSAYYRENTEVYTEKLRTLDDSFKALVDGCAHSQIVIADRFPMLYFTERYGIDYYAAFPGCSAQVEANPVTIAFLCDKVKSEGIPVIFKVDMSNGNVARSISEQTGAVVETLYSCHVISAEDFQNGETYITLMMRNYEAVKKAIS